MTEKIVKLVALSKPYKLPNGRVFETRRELEAYIEGLKNAVGNMENFMRMVIENASLPLGRESLQVLSEIDGENE